MPVTFATATHTGLVRGSNEDSFYVQEPVFMVADGMGGAQAGEVASGMAARAFALFEPQSDSPQDELAKLISRINSGIYEAAGGDTKQSGMGTTLTAASVAGDSVGIAHVGDSRAYLWRDNNLQQLTVDHSLVGELLREGKISSAEAAIHPQRSIITRVLGVDRVVEVDTDSIDWKRGDVFLLCSDGLHSMITDEEIAAVLGRGEDLTTTANGLVEAALSRGGADNVTVVLFCPDGSVTADVAESSVGMSTPAPAGHETAGEAEPVAEPVSATGPGPAIEPGSEPVKPPVPKPRRTFRQLFASVPGRIVTGLLIAAVILASAWFVTRQFYYVGVQGGRVSVFRGVPYDLGPWHLSSLYRSSLVNYDDLEPYEQERVSRQDLKSLGEAESMVENFAVLDAQRKEEAERKAKEERERSKTATTSTSIPPGAL